MKRHITILLLAGLLVCPAHAQPGTNTPPKTDFSTIFKRDKEKISYAIGIVYANGVKGRLKNDGVDYDPEVVAKAFSQALKGESMLITEEQENEVLKELSRQVASMREAKRKQQTEDLQAKGERNLTASPAFLAENKNKPGIVTLPSGLQYKVITEGTGAIPGPKDEVTVNYQGTLPDSTTPFDSSAKRGRPLTVRIENPPIKGWSEALQLMKVGSKWQIFVPPSLGFGANGHGDIPANSVLVFDIELLSSRTPPPPSAPPAHVAATPLTSDIIKVPSAEEMKKGAKIETIKQEDLDKEKAKAANP